MLASTCILCTQLRRLVARDGCTRAAAEARVAAQMSLSKKMLLADIVINNEGSLQELPQQVRVGVGGWVQGRRVGGAGSALVDSIAGRPGVGVVLPTPHGTPCHQP
jgi:hypothetical protein